MRIVITRPAARGAGFSRPDDTCVFVPLARTEPGPDPFPDPSGFDGVLFTSASAAELAPQNASWPKVGAVGPATKKALQARDIAVHVVGTGGGAQLAEAWGTARGQRLLLPQAAKAHPALAESLRESGAEVVVAKVYRTVTLPDPDVEELRRADLICFYAPSAVRAFVALGVETRATFWGHGETTRSAMTALQPQVNSLDEL